MLCWCVPPPLLGCAVLVCPPPPPLWGVLRWFMAPLLVGRAVLVHGPPLGGACCVAACPPRWWCLAWVVVMCWVGCGCGCVLCLAGAGAVLVCAPLPLLERAVIVRAPPLGGACLLPRPVPVTKRYKTPFIGRVVMLQGSIAVQT